MAVRAGPVRTTSGYRALKQSTESSSLTPPDIEDILPTHAVRITPYLLFTILIATLGPFQFGYHLGELNTPHKFITCQNQHSIHDKDTYLPQCIPMNAMEWGFVQSAFTVGGLSGALAAGHVATIHGRVFALRCLTVLLLLGAVLEASAPTMTTLIVGRMLAGMGAGSATVVSPIYVSEISPPAQRGLFGAFTQVMVNGGILVSQVLGYFLSNEEQWRFILVFPALLSTLTLASLSLVEESPRWLADNKAESSPYTNEATPLLLPRPITTSAKRHSITFIEAISITHHRRAVIVVAAVFMAQQLSGINSVVMYSVEILDSIIPTNAALVTIMVSGLNVLVSLLSTPLPDRLGRKTCLLLSISGMGTSSILLTIGLSQNIIPLTITALMLFVCSFAVGLGPVPFMLPSELVGTDSVGATSSWGLAASWTSTFCVAQFFPVFNGMMREGMVFLIFAGVALVLGVLIAWLLPETKGRSIDEVWES